ncbi:MAG TPA: 16S rRNA (cytosine(1402)-N(4))-methyltransferase RsmH [Burkholderiaceae bacterium]|nr:16S rRNA (cytosine(1402)-N(4))-methyltransferase RsmH [Burkholderiaceae bacterium]
MTDVLPSLHQPVLADAAVTHLITDPAGIYVDGTFGRGGHARRILERLAPTGRLIALDRDPEAAAAAAQISDPRFAFEHTRFSRMEAILAARGVTLVNGVLLDVGVSSPQIDDPVRGFSWRGGGPLDMRMDPTQGESAAEWLARVPVDELTRVIRDYGEERFAAPIAKAIVARRASGHASGQISTTADLAAVVARAIAGKSRAGQQDAQHAATRTFQAIRIHINQELEELALALEQAGRMLAPGGRLAVISFHSLEDRIVKRFIDAHAHPERAGDARAAQLPLRAHELPRPRLMALGKYRAGEAEVAANPRARSALLRVAERTAAQWESV